MARNIGYSLWLNIIKSIPKWEWITLVSIIASAIVLLLLYGLRSRRKRGGLFHAFEKLKIKRKDLDKAFNDDLYFEVTIPQDTQATAFQVQQKILKAFHSTYGDPIEGAHGFSKYIYFFQKLYRFIKIKRSEQVFFNMQIWAQYPYISFRLMCPRKYFSRIEKAIFNAYSNAEITMLDKKAICSEIEKFDSSFLAYGQTTIEGNFYYRVKTFRDVSSDPVDSIVSTMEGLEKGRYMVYNVFILPISHYFNQLIHYLIELQEKQMSLENASTELAKKSKPSASELITSLTIAMLEKMKASLFQVVISYWVVSPSREDAKSRLANIQAVLTEVNQKNMNNLKHKKLFTMPVENLATQGRLKDIVIGKPVLSLKRFKFWPFKKYKNHGQIVSDIELYSFWHLPNTDSATVSSIKMTKFKKLPASRQIREYDDGFFVDLGYSNFRMQEDTKIGVPTWDDMKRHIYLLGGTGSGKSETLKTILSNLLQKENEEKCTCLIIDPKNDFATDLLTMIPEERMEDVIYFNPQKQKDQPLSFPFFSQFSGEKTNDEKIEFLISIMKRFVQIDSLYSWGPELENILRQLFATAYLLPEQSLSGLDLLLHSPNQIKNILRYLPERLQKFWTTSILKRTDNDLAKYLATTNNKLGKFLDYPEFMNIADRLETKITFEEMIATGKIFIANLGSSSEQMKKYYSVYLTAHIAEAIFDQARLQVQDRKPTVFVVDEFQRVASDIFETLFSEVRAFNTSLVISNQFMGQLPETIQKSIESNIATKLFMRTQSVDDAEVAAKILGGKITTEDIINLPTGTAYIKTLVTGVPQDAMSIKVQKTFHPTDIVKDTEEHFAKQTMDRYGTPLEVIKQKRETINNIYYTDKREQIFHEQMGKNTVFAPIAEETEEVSIENKTEPTNVIFNS